jgi:NtrC-family two-component system response regulator AlgB
MRLLLIGDERRNRRFLAWGFATDEYSVRTVSSLTGAQREIERDSFQIACIDWKMEDTDPAAIADLVHDQLPELPIVALISEQQRRIHSTLKTKGVVASLVSPFPIEHLHSLLREHALDEPVSAPKPAPPPPPPPKKPVPEAALRVMASDDTARRTVELAMRAAKSNAAILILGETGTGKSLLAQTIHRNSAISEKPFVTVNCPCLSHELLESDLFGHMRGSFTGAVQDTWGKVAAAEGGTLFLDEIGDLPMTLQPKLLRLLQEKQYERIGEATSRTANVRIIAATNRDLKTEVAAGRFREDLFYRLNVIAIDVPPLRGRPSQIMGTAEAFLETICHDLRRPCPRFTMQARRLLESYGWPGNLRELRNVVERAAILSSGLELEEADFPSLIAHAPTARYQVGGAISLQALENAHIQMVVANSSSLEEAARILAIDKSTLYRKRKQMEARVARFTTPTEIGADAVATAS